MKINILALYSGPPFLKWNTDKKLSKEFKQIADYSNKVIFKKMPFQPYTKGTINFILGKFSKEGNVRRASVDLKTLDADIIYQYGSEFIIKRNGSNTPIVKTTGFPMTRNELESKEEVLQEIANKIAYDNVDVDCIHFHTDIARIEFLKRKPELSSKCVTIPFFMPQLNFINDNDLIDKFSSKTLEILFVGSEGERKGIFDLCEAIDLISNDLNILNAHVTFISRDKPKLSNFSNFTYLKWAPRLEILQIMKKSHIFCLPTRRDSFGLVFVEAMSQGCATIGDDDFPRHEIFGTTGGLLVPSKSPKLLSDSLSKLIHNRDIQLMYAKEGRDRTRAIYSPNIVANRYSDLFKSLILNSNADN